LDIAKADMGIAAMYAGLVTDEELRHRIYNDLRAEHERSQHMIAQVLELSDDEFIANMPVLQRSIERRNPYVDPLNFIQVDLLRKLRQLEPGTPGYEDILNAVLDTINGIAAGMKTTG
jgi:phosphoenolpyruvate carboxylase